MVNKKILHTSLVAAMALSLLTGCSLMPPKSASDVYERCMKQNNRNYTIDATIEENIISEVDGTNVKIPVEFKINADMADDYAHTNMSIKMDASFMSIGTDVEMYVDSSDNDKILTYTKLEDDTWCVSESKESKELAGISNLISDAIMENAEFEKTDSGYKITANTEKLADNKDFNNAIEDTLSMLSQSAGISAVDAGDGIADAYADSKLVYEFDKNCNLVAVNLSEFECKLDGMKVELDFSVKVSNIGSIKKNDVTVPNDVKENAIDEKDIKLNEEADTESKVTDDVKNDETVVDKAETITSYNGTYADIENMFVEVNGKKFKIGEATLNDMINSGVKFNDIEISDNKVKPNYESETFKLPLSKDGYYKCMFSFLNTSDEIKSAKDCILYQVYIPVQQDKQMDENVVKFSFPLNITEEELIKNSGEPTERSDYEDGDYYSHDLEYTVKSDKYYAKYGYDFEFIKGELKYVYLTKAN